MGRKIVLTGTTLTDSTAPKLATIDPIESDGSLFLIEPAHPVEAWASGVPANATTVPNVLGVKAAAFAGAAESALDFTVNRGAGWDGTTDGLLERTADGGLHGIVSQGSAASTTFFYLTSDAVRDYLRNNSDNDLYISLWVQKTRAEISSSVPSTFGEVTSGPSPTANYLYSFNAVGSAVGSPSHRTITTTAWTGTHPGAGFIYQNFILLGRYGGKNNFSTTQQSLPSAVIYRAYLEDLTVSGRTAAEVEAIDAALFASAFGSGGRYEGDTYTSPATIP